MGKLPLSGARVPLVSGDGKAPQRSMSRASVLLFVVVAAALPASSGGALKPAGDIVPLGVKTPLAADGSAGVSDGSLAAFRLVVQLPGGLADQLTTLGRELRLAVESELVERAAAAQTPPSHPRSHLRVRTRDGAAEISSRATSDFVLVRNVPVTSDSAAQAALTRKYRHQSGFNRFVSPWVVAIADPRASEKFAWSSNDAATREAAGCFVCARPSWLTNNKTFELWTGGRILAARLDCGSASGDCSSPFAGTKYAYLGEKGRLEGRATTVPGDLVRDPRIAIAGQHPPLASGALQESIYVHSGEMETANVDLVAGGRADWNVGVARAYRSRTYGGTTFGPGWDSPLLRRLRMLPDGSVEYRDGASEVWTFTQSGSASGGVTSFDSPKGLFLKLARRADGSYELVDQKWRITRFDRFGRLSSESDEFHTAGQNNGNTIHYLYDASGRLAQIVDPVERITSVTYWSEAEAGSTGAWPGFIKEVKDWRGRSVRYEYDPATALLTKVLLPKAKAAEGVPAAYDYSTDATRPAIRYTYQSVAVPTNSSASPSSPASSPSSSYTDYLELSANLESITEPDEVAREASGGGAAIARVEHTYGASTNAFERDRVLTQTWPCASWTGVCAPRDATFEYVANVTTITDILGQKRAWNYGVQSDGRAHVTTEKVFAVPVIEKATSGLPASIGVAEETAPKDLTTTYDEFTEHGQPKLVTLPNGLQVKREYEAAAASTEGNVLKSVEENGGASSITTEFIFEQIANAFNTLKAIKKTLTGLVPANRILTSAHRGRLSVERDDEDVKQQQKYRDDGLPSESNTYAAGADPASATKTTSMTADYHSATSTNLNERGRPSVLRSGTDAGETRISYAAAAGEGEEEKATDSREVTSTVVRDAYDRPIAVETRDANQTLLKKERYAYDAAGRLTLVIREQKNVGAVEEHFTYDVLGRTIATKTTRAEVMGQTSAIETAQRYDLSAKKITSIAPHVSGAAGTAPVTEATIDALGRTVRTETRSEGETDRIQSVLAYDIHGKAAYQSDTHRTASITAHDQLGRPVGTLGTDGISTQVSWNAWHEPELTRVFGSDGVEAAKERRLHTTMGRLRAINEELQRETAAGQPAKIRSTRFHWTDGAKSGSRVGLGTTIDGNLNANAFTRVRESLLDAAGRVELTRIGGATGNGELVEPQIFGEQEITWAGEVPFIIERREPRAGAAYKAVQVYDGLGRVVENSDAETYDSRISYDELGNVIAHTAPGMAEATATYDSRGLAKETKHPDGASIKRTYDALGNLRSYTDEQGKTTTYDTDALGRVTKITYADGTFEQTKFENVTGAVLATRDRAGQWLSYRYDNGGRVTEIRNGEDPSAGDPVMRYNYDAAGRIILSSNKDAAVTLSGYDAAGRPRTVQTYRYANGTGLDDTPAVLDVHTQTKVWDEFDEVTRWSLPVAGTTTAPPDLGSGWRTWIDEERDAAGNLVRQRVAPDETGAATDTEISSATARGVGTLLLRNRTTAAGSLASLYDFFDGFSPGSTDEPGSSTPADETKSGLLRGVESVLGDVTVAGTTSTRDSAKRIESATDLGLGSRSSWWNYDGRGRLERSLLFAAADESEELEGVAETLLSADFRSGRGARGVLSESQQAVLGSELSLAIEPARWTAESNDAHQLVNRKLFVGDEAVQTLAYAFEGGRRHTSGSWTNSYDAFGRLISSESAEEGRKFTFVYDPNDRIVGRTAWQSDAAGGWTLETRTNVLARDGLPAETTWVWDPFTDRLVAIFEAGKSGGDAPSPAAGLLRQYIHGDQAYDDPIEILARLSTLDPRPTRYLPIIDEGGTGSLQAVVRDDGVLVERVLYGDSYGDAPKYLQGPIVDDISYDVKKDGIGNISQVIVRVHLTEKIREATAETGVIVTSYDSDDLPVVELSGAVALDADDPYTLLRTFSAAEWSSLTANPAEVIEIAVTNTLRAEGWGETAVAPVPEWAQSLYGTRTSSDRPVAHRESLTSITDFLASIPPGEARSTQLYAIADLYMAASEESKSKLLTGFKAAPFVEANGLVYFRNRFYDPSTGSWLTPDSYGTRDSSNLYAGLGLNPVGNRDATGEYIESLWDLASLSLGAYQISQWDEDTSLGMRALDVVGVAIDTAALVLPLIPGGVGAGLKAYRAGDAMHDGYTTGRSVDRAIDTAQGVDQGLNVGQAGYYIAEDSRNGTVGWGTGVNALQAGIGMRSISTRGVGRHRLDFSRSHGTLNSIGSFGGVRLTKRARDWQEYEEQIADLYGGRQAFGARKYRVKVGGEWMSGVADNITRVGDQNIAVDAKFVRDWSTSIRNPRSPMALGSSFRQSRTFAKSERVTMLQQARKYSEAFDEVIYHSNSPELIHYYSRLFKRFGLSNVTFRYTP